MIEVNFSYECIATLCLMAIMFCVIHIEIINNANAMNTLILQNKEYINVINELNEKNKKTINDHNILMDKQVIVMTKIAENINKIGMNTLKISSIEKNITNINNKNINITTVLTNIVNIAKSISGNTEKQNKDLNNIYKLIMIINETVINENTMNKIANNIISETKLNIERGIISTPCFSNANYSQQSGEHYNKLLNILKVKDENEEMVSNEETISEEENN